MPTEILQVDTASTASGFANWNIGAGTNKVAAVNQPDDDAASYIQAKAGFPGGSTWLQKFTIQNSSIGSLGLENPTIVINSVSIKTRGRADGNHSFVTHLLLSGTEVDNAHSHTSYPSTGWFDYTDTYTVKSAGVPFTVSDLDNLEVILGAYYYDVTTVYILIDYSYTETPNDPDDLAIDSEAFNFVTLSWDDNSAIETGHIVERSLDGTTWGLLATLAANVETYTDATVHSSTHYYYRVYATGVDHNSDFSNVVDLVTDAPSGPPDVPLGLTSIGKTPTSLPVVWFDTTNDLADSFELQKSADGGSTWSDAIVLPSETPFYTFLGLLPGSTYTIRVRSLNSVGTSSYTSTITESTPERDFRYFLEKEILQDTARFLQWTDSYNTTQLPFSVHQQIHFTPNMPPFNTWGFTILSAPYDPRNISLEAATIQNAGGFLGRHIEVWPDLQTISVEVPTFTTSIKLDSPLVMDVPNGTIFATIVLSLPGGPTNVRLIVGNTDLIVNSADDDEEYFGAEPVFVGAKVGSTIIEMDFQVADGAGWGPVRNGFPMGPTYSFNGAVGRWGAGTLRSGIFDVDVPVDLSLEARNAQPIYDAITAEALLRIGFIKEIDVPHTMYQQFRDAGRVEAWRAVAYATCYKQRSETSDGSGDVKYFGQFHTFAAQQLNIAEQEYLSRYGAPAVGTSTIISNKPTRNSYDGKVEVRW